MTVEQMEEQIRLNKRQIKIQKRLFVFNLILVCLSVLTVIYNLVRYLQR